MSPHVGRYANSRTIQSMLERCSAALLPQDGKSIIEKENQPRLNHQDDELPSSLFTPDAGIVFNPGLLVPGAAGPDPASHSQIRLYAARRGFWRRPCSAVRFTDRQLFQYSDHGAFRPACKVGAGRRVLRHALYRALRHLVWN